ncbi:MBL fold metallo-hydrolase [Nesterenkonia haasae]|uniref:MBL fold metallo-hydrolase n=1 Tax=Nesterenkonia haasae TaxID=2587813 RepID=UPI001391B82E|nr:MBL fold metallo-hydrolase [Nesterenkonia haasae]NDK31535.1 MBL fold metallo-hydrolase [Nesterenkonia haasae]
MLLERIYDEDLAQASYFIGCQSKGEAVVIDARRDLSDYFDLADRHGMRITAVAETHIHADYLSGTRELAAATEADAYVSGEGGEDWQYGFDAKRLNHGDVVSLGNIRLEARHTPDHTPEHLVFLVTDGAFSNDPGYMISGDFVFAGDLGRPDLLDEAAGGQDTRFEGAKQLYRSLRNEFVTLPDHVMVYPGHGAGSACGKALGALPSTTVGYERHNAWWSQYVSDDDEQGFIDELLDGQPDAHAYFGRMKRENKDGPYILGPQGTLVEMTVDQVRSALEGGRAIFVDTRSHDMVKHGTPVGALNIPAGGKTASFGAWAYDPERETRPLILLAEDQEQAESLREHLMRVGVDRVKGYITSLDGLPKTQPATITPAELENFEPALLLDVRNKSEHAEGHVPGSEQLSAGRVLWHQDQLPPTGPIVTYCQSGVRNSVAASALRREGHDVRELVGSYAGWAEWKQSH